MKEKNKTEEAEEKINYIYQVLQRIGNAEMRSGFHYIVWGTAIALAMMAHYVFILNDKSELATYTWISITFIATVLSVMYAVKEIRSRKVYTNENAQVNTVSLIFHSFLFLLLFVVQQMGLETIPLVFMVYGAWLLAVGSLIRFRPFIAGGILNWIMVLTAIYISLPYQLILGAIVCLLSYTLPGYLLNKRMIKNA